MKNLIYFFLLSLFIMSCNTTTENTNSEGDKEEITPMSFDGKHCFLETVPHEPIITGNGDTIHFIDSTVIQLKIAGDKVKGIFNWMPAEKDQAYGTVKGTIKDDIIKAVYSYTIEGSDQKEEKIFQLRKDAIAIKIGELEEDAEGVLRLKDADKAEFNEVILKVPCD